VDDWAMPNKGIVNGTSQDSLRMKMILKIIEEFGYYFFYRGKNKGAK
jgi:hypothetical protein